MELDTDIIIIGAGMSGLGFAIQLLRQYGHRNFEIIERASRIGGTWQANTYPGCGVDIVAHFYAYSFYPNPNWSRKYPLQPEILDYINDIAAKYDVEKHVKFNTEVGAAHWEASSGTWLVTIKNLKTSETYQRRCKILISATGLLSVPNRCDIRGASSFQGRLFHTAEWDHSFDWKGKELVVIGNGCSATQAVPVLSQGDASAKKITQFARQPHWLFERPNPEYSSLFKFTMKWVPLVMRAYRALLTFYSDIGFLSFDTVGGVGIRKKIADIQGAYMRRTSPEKYHDFLMPKIEVGCKRIVMDTDYLECLNRDNVELVHDDPIDEIIESGVRTKSGRLVNADAIILANGFHIFKTMLAVDLRGEGGTTVTEHWDKFSQGSPSAYFGTCLSSFPNYFILMGPNTASGHGSVVYTSECQINFTLRAIKPVLNALRAQRSRLPVLGQKADIVKVKPDAEQADVDMVQEKAKALVWATGCISWALDPKSNFRRNTTMYPDFQFKYWLRSTAVPWNDFELSRSEQFPKSSALGSFGIRGSLALTTCVAAAAWWLHRGPPLKTML
ncbi:putative monooxygenase [Xylaria intraflava]|nr:putative monooxygenase [Xylaria intraflava]